MPYDDVGPFLMASITQRRTSLIYYRSVNVLNE